MKLVFIPGLLCTEAVWGGLNSLRKSSACVDMNINGYSSIEEVATRELGKLDQTESYCVIGISLGGYIALEIAARNLPQVKKLVLINTTYDVVNPATINDRKQAINLATQDGLDAVLNIAPGFCFYNKKREYLELERKMALETGAKNYITQQECILSRRSYLSDLNRIQANTLIITSKDDPVLPYTDSLTLFEKIPNSALTAFSGCGHLATIERSNETLMAVAGFINNGG
jgi:pimeloyl-ACP methyl ester carboxylesterase